MAPAIVLANSGRPSHSPAARSAKASCEVALCRERPIAKRRCVVKCPFGQCGRPAFPDAPARNMRSADRMASLPPQIRPRVARPGWPFTRNHRPKPQALRVSVKRAESGGSGVALRWLATVSINSVPHSLTPTRQATMIPKARGRNSAVVEGQSALRQRQGRGACL